MMQAPEIFQSIYARHGHRCPMSTLGGRMGLAALRRLDAVAGQSLTALFEHDTCAVDGIEVTTGCRQADKALEIRNTGRHVLTLRRADGRGVRVGLKGATLATAAEYRTADEAFEAGKGNLTANELRALQEKKETVLQAVLEQFWSRPDDELLDVEMLGSHD